MSEEQKPPQPPSEPSTPPPKPSPSPGTGGIEENVAGALAYFVIIAIVWLVLEPYNKNRFIRFHSIQAIALGVVFTGLSIVLGAIPIVGWILLPFVSLAAFVIWVLCFVKAFQNEKFKLPVLGDFAEKQADAMSA